MKAVFSPGPSYYSEETRKYAGWVKIFDLYRDGLKELGYEVLVPKFNPDLIDQTSTVSKITSYDLTSAVQIPSNLDLFLGPPGYSLAQMLSLPKSVRKFLFVFNCADWWRDQQLAKEYKRFNQPYDLSPMWRWINETALKISDCVLACSPWVKKTHARVVPEDKIQIAFWGVDSKKFHPPDVELPGFNVLFVGGDPIRKGLGYLVEAMKGMSGVELWVVGCEYPWSVNLSVRSFGMLPHGEMIKVYQQCHVICIPTLEDGIALAIQEGMSCGLVPVTSPETAEVFEHGVSGWRVDYRDVEGIRSYLQLLRDNPDILHKMSGEARKLAERQTWEVTKEQFKDIIKREMNL